jgi:hypothetical protein
MGLRTPGATYGALVDVASAQVVAATIRLALGPMSGPIAAREAVAAYRALLGAIHAHIRALFTVSQRLEVVAVSVAPDPRDAAALHLVRGLQRFALQHSLIQDTVAGPGVAWRAAAVSLRAATDLLGTHHARDGEARTPEALQLERSSVRAAGLAGVGDLARTVLAAERDLGLRAGQAGMVWVEVGRLLPDLSQLQDAARALATPVESGPARAALHGLAVAGPGVRTGEPIVELSDRLLRLRRVAWQLTREPHVGIATLSDFAVAAVAFHTHALAAVSCRGQSIGCAPQRAAGAAPLVAARAAWAQAHLQSREMCTATPAVGVVRADTLAIRKLCQTLMPLDPAANRAADANLRPVIFGGARAFGEIAEHAASVLAELDASGNLYLPARSLTGAEVTEDPSLVRAKLQGDTVRVPHSRVGSLAHAYEAAQAPLSRTRSPSSAAHGSPTRGRQAPTNALALSGTIDGESRLR